MTTQVKINDTFNEWTVIAGPLYKHTRAKHWTCECTCGAIKDVSQYNLTHNFSKNCGKHRLISEETKASLKEARRNQPPPRPKGSITSDVTRQKMRDAWARRKQLKETQQ